MKTSKKSAVFLTDALKKNFIFPLGIIVCIVFSALQMCIRDSPLR